MTSGHCRPILSVQALVGPQGLVIAFVHLRFVELPSQVADVDKPLERPRSAVGTRFFSMKLHVVQLICEWAKLTARGLCHRIEPPSRPEDVNPIRIFKTLPHREQVEITV